MFANLINLLISFLIATLDWFQELTAQKAVDTAQLLAQDIFWPGTKVANMETERVHDWSFWSYRRDLCCALIAQDNRVSMNQLHRMLKRGEEVVKTTVRLKMFVLHWPPHLLWRISVETTISTQSGHEKVRSANVLPLSTRACPAVKLPQRVFPQAALLLLLLLPGSQHNHGAAITARE